MSIIRDNPGKSGMVGRYGIHVDDWSPLTFSLHCVYTVYKRGLLISCSIVHGSCVSAWST